MKRIISIILSTAILLSCCFMLSGCADNPEKNFILSNKMKSDYIKQFEIEGVESSEVLLEYYAGTYGDGYAVVMLDASCHDFDEWQEEIGNSTIKYQDTNRLLVYKDGKFSTLTEAYENGALLSNDIGEIATKFNSEITFFYQICDKFDFDDSYVFTYPDSFNYETEYVEVVMYSKFVEKGIIPPISYFGADIIKSIRTYDVSNLEGNECNIRLVLGLHISSKVNVKYVESRLKKIPGIKEVSLIGTAMWASTYPNDTEYRGSKQWGLSDIKFSLTRTSKRILTARSYSTTEMSFPRPNDSPFT